MSFTLREMNKYRVGEVSFKDETIVNPKSQPVIDIVDHRPASDIRERLLHKWELLQRSKRGELSTVKHQSPCRYPFEACRGCGNTNTGRSTSIIDLTSVSETSVRVAGFGTPYQKMDRPGLTMTNDPCPHGCGVLLRYDNILEGNICIKCRSIFRSTREKSHVVIIDQAERAKAEIAAGEERFRALIEHDITPIPRFVVNDTGEACYCIWDDVKKKYVPAKEGSWGYSMSDD